SARSRISVMFAAKISRARLNTGPLSQAATGASRVTAGSDSGTSRGVRIGTFASRISSSGIEIGSNRGAERIGDRLRGTNRCADRERAREERGGDGDQGASEWRLRRHFEN